jgi:hypothetical protein
MVERQTALPSQEQTAANRSKPLGTGAGAQLTRRDSSNAAADVKLKRRPALDNQLLPRITL